MIIHRISITKYRDAEINRVKSIVQVSVLQTYMMSIFIKNNRGSFAKKQWHCKPDFIRQYFMHTVKSFLCKYQ